MSNFKMSQHMPGFMYDGQEMLTAEASTVSDLLQVPWVANWRSGKSPWEFRASVSGDLLMATRWDEKEGEEVYLVVGRMLEGSLKGHLPEWRSKPAGGGVDSSVKGHNQ